MQGSPGQQGPHGSSWLARRVNQREEKRWKVAEGVSGMLKKVRPTCTLAPVY